MMKNEHSDAVTDMETTRIVKITNLEETQLISLDDLKDMEDMQAAIADEHDLTNRPRGFVPGTVFALVLAAIFLVTAFLVAHVQRNATAPTARTMQSGVR